MIFSDLNSRFFRKTNKQVRRRREIAYQEVVSWNSVISEQIKHRIFSYADRYKDYWKLCESSESKDILTIDLFFSDDLDKNCFDKIDQTRRAATIVYCIEPNGSVIVLVYTNSSLKLDTQEHEKCFVINAVSHARKYAGDAGSKRVIKDLRKFLRIAFSADRCALNSRSTASFFRGLEVRGAKLAKLFPPNKRCSDSQLSNEVSFGIGLASGLIASAIWPFAKDFGSEKGALAKDIEERCKALTLDHVFLVKCLENGGYHVNKFVSEALSTGVLLMLALSLTAVALFKLWRMSKDNFDASNDVYTTFIDQFSSDKRSAARINFDKSKVQNLHR